MLKNLDFFIFIISLLGFLINRRSIIILFIGIEVMLVSCGLNIILSGIIFDSSISLLWIVVILIIAGVESAIGLSLLVLYYRIKGNINIDET